ncbi:MAG: extracellular solute-binding protein [Opitutales bacterium]
MIKPFDPSKFDPKRSFWRNGITLSLVAIVVLVALIKVMTTLKVASPGDLNVYCAAGLRKPIMDAATAFEEEFNVDVKFDFASSGGMEAKLELDADRGRAYADLFIPADIFFANRARGKGLTAESVSLASFRLVVASKHSANLEISSLDDIIEKKISFAICDPEAAAGKTTMQALQNLEKWNNFFHAKKASFPTVNETAVAVQTSDAVQVGFVWNTTAQQYGLKIHDLPGLAEVRSSITANVTTSSDKPAQALLFARYLAAAEKGQPFFVKHHFTSLPGDTWAVTPELILYCGGVNREAIEDTIKAFQKREGCLVLVQYAGCGTLVSGIKAIQSGDGKGGMPDAFMTCDASYMSKVSELFGEASDVSATDVVLLVRKGNPKTDTIGSLDDLAEPSLLIGTTDPEKSTLGDLSWQLLEGWGIADGLKENETFRTWPTAHELIGAMGISSKMDVAMVYRANCQNLPENEFKIITIQDPLAEAIQNVAVAKVSRYPQLTERLIEAITSSESKERFQKAGFRWKASAAASNE